MENIIKIKSIKQRLYLLDSQGNLSSYLFDHKFNQNNNYNSNNNNNNNNNKIIF
jgi:hypothetical protein